MLEHYNYSYSITYNLSLKIYCSRKADHSEVSFVMSGHGAAQHLESVTMVSIVIAMTRCINCFMPFMVACSEGCFIMCQTAVVCSW